MPRGELYGISLRSASPSRGLPLPQKVTAPLAAVSETATQKRIIKLIDAMPNNFDFNEIEALKETIAQFSID